MLSWALLASACPGGRPDPGLCPGALFSGACAVGFVLPAAQPTLRSRCSSPSELLWVLPCALQSLGSLAHSPGAQVPLSVPGSPRASPPSWGPALTPCEPLSTREGWCSSCFSGTGLSCPGDTRPGLSPAPCSAPLPWRPFVSLFLFPCLPTLIEAGTLLTVAFQLFSL